MSASTRPPALPECAGLTWRPLTASDLDTWHGLVRRVQQYDREKERLTRADLRTILTGHRNDLVADTRLGVDDAGQPWAWARNVCRRGHDDVVLMHVTGGVDPARRGHGVGRVLFGWQLARARQAAQQRRRARSPGGSSAAYRVGRFVEEHIPARRTFVERFGLSAERWYSELRRPLPSRGLSDPTVRRLAGRLQVQPYQEVDVTALVPVFNLAFAGQWGTRRYTAQSWVAGVEANAAFRPEQSFVVVDGGRRGRPVVGFVINSEYQEDWPQQGYTEGYTDYLGVVPSMRGQGVATRLLECTAHEFALQGHPYTTLAVDADNPTPAAGLYASLGYRPHHVTAFYGTDA